MAQKPTISAAKLPTDAAEEYAKSVLEELQNLESRPLTMRPAYGRLRGRALGKSIDVNTLEELG